MITFQFVPYHEIEDLGSARRVKKLIDIVVEFFVKYSFSAESFLRECGVQSCEMYSCGVMDKQTPNSITVHI